MGLSGLGFKTSETLLGIETRYVIQRFDVSMYKRSFKTSETLLGIETSAGSISL